MSRTFREVTYTCAREGCGNQQTVRYFADDPMLPITCCTKCRSGFGVDLPQMMEQRKGMFPSKPVFVSA